MIAFPASALIRRLGLLCAALTLSACMGRGPELDERPAEGAIDLGRQEMALVEVEQKQSRGERIWCVPFARTVSGVEIKGDAKTWWKSAAGTYRRGDQPRPGAVMSFASTRKMSRGHVAVVSDVISDREIRINHANWVRNKVQLDMAVIDISARNDWSEVRVERTRGEMGTGSYPINGFIYPK